MDVEGAYEYCAICPNIDICNVKMLYSVLSFPMPCPGHDKRMGYYDFIRPEIVTPWFD